MMIEVRVPSPGESISQVQLASWLVSDGDYVEKDQEIAEVDSDKATLAVPAPEAGVVKILVQAGETVAVGAVVCTLDTDAAQPAGKKETVQPVQEKVVSTPIPAAPAKAAADAVEQGSGNLHISPLARKLMQENALTEAQVEEMLKSIRIGKKDIQELVTLKGSSLQNKSR